MEGSEGAGDGSARGRIAGNGNGGTPTRPATPPDPDPDPAGPRPAKPGPPARPGRVEPGRRDPEPDEDGGRPGPPPGGRQGVWRWLPTPPEISRELVKQVVVVVVFTALAFLFTWLTGMSCLSSWPRWLLLVVDLVAVVALAVLWLRRGGGRGEVAADDAEPETDPGPERPTAEGRIDTDADGRERPRRRWPVVAMAGVVVGLLAVTALVAVGCDDTDDCGRDTAGAELEVVVVWSGRELAAFCDVVELFGHVAVDSVGPGVGAALDDRWDSPPDVAIIPQPSLVRRYGADGRLCEANHDAQQRVPAPWLQFTRGKVAGAGPELVFGALVKGTLKSMFWYNTELVTGTAPEEWSFDDLRRWVGDWLADHAAEPGSAPLRVPTGDRWPLTDWFEVQLAGTDRALYEDLARGVVRSWDDPDVVASIDEVLTDIGLLWSQDGAFDTTTEELQDLEWEDVVDDVGPSRPVLVFGPSFLAGAIDELPGEPTLRPTGFPSIDGRRPFVVAGDYAVVPRQNGGCTGTGVGDEFVDFLTGRRALRLWSSLDLGFLTPNVESPYYRPAGANPPPDPAGEAVPPDLQEDIHVLTTSMMFQPPAHTPLLFDLSDDQFAAIHGGDARETWESFAQFYEEVTTHERTVDCAVDRVMARLQAAYENSAPADIDC
jgi:alpha-glucoside transport system substrate-binding protein